MPTHFVYLLVFPDDRIYVGMSRVCQKGMYTNRFRQHQATVNAGKVSPLYDAWRLLGAPTQYIISEHPDRYSCGQAEKEFIFKFDATNPQIGLNVALGGNGIHAPKGSAIHRVLRTKVWDNEERNLKLSAALKGRPVSDETTEGFKAWMLTEGPQSLRDRMTERWGKPGAREHQSQKTREQMTPEAREHLRRIHTGRPDPRNEEGKKATAEKRAAYLATPKSREDARRGYDAFASKPENLAANKEALNKWRASDVNRENCKRIAKLSAEKCRRGVEDLQTGVVYSSQRDMARALGVSDAAVSLRVKTGKARRVLD